MGRCSGIAARAVSHNLLLSRDSTVIDRGSRYSSQYLTAKKRYQVDLSPGTRPAVSSEKPRKTVDHVSDLGAILESNQ